jgi:uncharacterized repeat protein (TIGR01451 family)
VIDTAGIQVCNHFLYQYWPSVAYGGGNYQVVWYDLRGNGLYGNRVSAATGALLDGGAGAEIAGAVSMGAVLLPSIAGTGTGYYVTWQGGGPDTIGSDVFGSRVTLQPFLLDAPGTRLALSANGEHQVAAAADGVNYLVVWTDDRGGERAIYGARVNGVTGASLDPAGILLSAGGSGESSPAVAFNGNQYLVVWSDRRSPNFAIWGTRVSTAGTVLDPAGLSLFTGMGQYSPNIASDGTGWFVVWNQYTANGNDVYGGRISAAGTALDPAGIVISNAPGDQWIPRVGFGGGYYLATWADYGTGDLYGARVSPSGVVQEPAGIPIAVGPDWVPLGGYAVAYATGSFVVPYTTNGGMARARIEAATGIVQDTTLITLSGASKPAIAFDSDTFVVVYTQSGQGFNFGERIRATRLDANGADLDLVDWDVVTDSGVAFEPYERMAAVAAPSAGGGSVLVAYSRYDPTPGVTSDRARARLVFHGTNADLALTKTDGQTTVVPGEPVTYTIAVSNSGPDAVAAVQVVDTFPAALTGTTWSCVASPGSSCTAAGSGHINDTASLAAGGGATYTATGTVAATATGSLTNTATVATSDPDPGNNSATDVDTIVPEADLSITKSDSADPVSPGDPLTYTLDFTNNGPSNATAVTVVDTLPGGVTFVSSVPGAPTCTLAGATLTCGIGGLTAGASGTVTVNVTVNAGASGMLVNTATVSGAETDPDTNNNTASAATAIGRRDGELSHGTDELYDLAALPGPVADEDVFRINQKPYSSYEVVIDATSGDIGNGSGPVLERLAPDGTTVIQTSVAIGTGPSRSLRWMNATPFEVEGETVRVRSAGCTTDCGPDDVYRIRAYETTYSIARFNNTGSQVTVLILQNRTSDLMVGVAIFWDLSGIPACGSLFGLGAHSTLVLDTRDCPGVNGIAGSITVANTMPYGEISGKAVALEPSTGFSFDSPLVPRLR